MEILEPIRPAERSRHQMTDLDWNMDYCYECTAYGNDYYINKFGELIPACEDCPFNPLNQEED